MATITQKLGDRVRKLRKKGNLSQEELAARTRLDLTTINEIEAGNRNPSLKTIHKLAMALSITLSELFDF